MRKLGKLFSQRVYLVALFILLQVIVMMVTVTWLSEYRPWVNGTLRVLSLVAVLYLTRPLHLIKSPGSF